MRSNQYTISQTASLFTEWTLAMPSDFSLTAGIGSSSMGIELNDRFYVATNNNPSNVKGTHFPTQYQKTYNGMVSPHLALNKVFNKQLSAYASYSKGYKAPVSSYFFIPVTGTLNTNLKPEIGTQYEIGAKGSLLDEKLNFQIALFNAKFADKMTTVAVPNATNTATSYVYVANGGTQNNKGLELLVKYTAYRSNTGFVREIKPFLNMAYSDFMYENFTYQQLNTAKTGVVTVDYSGKKVVGVPPMTANIGLDVTTNAGLYGSLTFMHRDAMYFTSDNVNKTAAYDVLNGKIGFQKTLAEHWGLDVYAGAINLTGTQYYQMVFSNQMPDAYLPAPNKANFFGGVSLKYVF
jgi:iron complex outermembrane receptor protein